MIDRLVKRLEQISSVDPLTNEVIYPPMDYIAASLLHEAEEMGMLPEPYRYKAANPDSIFNGMVVFDWEDSE